MTMLKRVQFAVRSVRSTCVKKSLQEPFSFTHYGDVTEAYTDHAHMETVLFSCKTATIKQMNLKRTYHLHCWLYHIGRLGL